MLLIRRILFPTDFSSCSDQAMRHALYLANRFNAELHILNVEVMGSGGTWNGAGNYPQLGAVRARIGNMDWSQIDNQLKHCGLPPTRLRKVRRRSLEVAPEILDYAKANDIGLVVAGTHGRGSLGNLMLGSVAEQLVRHSPCPVLTVRPSKGNHRIGSPGRILVPVDFSESSKAALFTAGRIGSGTDTQLDLLHVVDERRHPEFRYGYLVPDLAANAPEIYKIAQKRIESWSGEARKALGGKGQVTGSVVKGIPTKDITSFASSHGSDLIVIATHGRTGLRRAFLGSVAEKILRKAPCPVLTVKALHRSMIGEPDRSQSALRDSTVEYL